MTTHDKWLKLLKVDKAAMASFFLYLNEMRSANQDYLLRADSIEVVKRLQGSIITIDEILNLVTEDEFEEKIQKQYLGDITDESDRSLQH